MLSEYVAAYKAGLDFYGDPKNKAKGTNDTSFLTGGKKDRARYAKEMPNAAKKKDKKDE